MAVHTSTTSARPTALTHSHSEPLASRRPQKPALPRTTTIDTLASAAGHTKVVVPDDRQEHVKSLPLFQGVKTILALRRYEEAAVPFFYLRGRAPFAEALSGRLDPRQRPPVYEEAVAHAEASEGPDETQILGESSETESPGFGSSFEETRQARAARKALQVKDRQIGARAFAALNTSLHLDETDGMLVMHHVDAALEQDIRLGYWQQLAEDARACAIVNCLLRLSPNCSFYLSDSELLCNTLAAACLMAGCLVCEDQTTAEHLVSRIPQAQRGRAQALVQDYVDQHDLWPIKDHVSPEAGLLGDTTQALSWQNPSQWPSLIKDTALWLLDLTLAETAD